MGAEPDGGGCDLGADPPGADDRQSAPRSQSVAKRHGIVERADGHLRTVSGQPDRGGARGQHEGVVRLFPGVGRQRALRQIEAGRTDAWQEVDAQLGQVEAEVGIAGLRQDALGQRRPVIRRVLLGPHESQLALEAGSAQRSARTPAAQAGTDHDHPLGTSGHDATRCAARTRSTCTARPPRSTSLLRALRK